MCRILLECLAGVLFGFLGFALGMFFGTVIFGHGGFGLVLGVIGGPVFGLLGFAVGIIGGFVVGGVFDPATFGLIIGALILGTVAGIIVMPGLALLDELN